MSAYRALNDLHDAWVIGDLSLTPGDLNISALSRLSGHGINMADLPASQGFATGDLAGLQAASVENFVGHDRPSTGGATAPAAMSAFGDRVWQGIAAGREVADAAETTATTYSLSIGQSFYGRVSDANDEDWIAVQLVAGQTYDFRLLGLGAGFLNDPLLRLYNSAGVEITSNDDGFTSNSSSHEADSRLVFTATTTGVHYLSADAYQTATGDYLLTATAHNPAGMVFTADEIAWQLINNGADFFGAPEAARFNVGVDNTLTVDITQLTTEGKYLARQALLAWSAVTNITFAEVAGAAEITFDDNQNSAFAQPVTSGGAIIRSTVNVGLDWLTSFGTTLNSYSFETYIHEIGHALGLAHGGNYNGSANYGTDNYYLNDGLAWSIMSYMQADNDEFDFGGAADWNTFLDASFRYMMTPMIADIIAIQHLYGVSTEFGGDTTWGFGGNTGITAIDTAAGLGALMAMTVYDTGGVDTLDFSQTSQAQVISLASESMSSVLGGRHNLSIARSVTIENAIGGSGADTIRGNAAANTLTGGAGIDSLDGGAGADTLIGGLDDDTYILDDLGDRVIEARNQGVDKVISSVDFSALAQNAAVETITLTGTARTAIGDGFANTLIGNASNNVLNGYKGADRMEGGAGNDVFYIDNAGDVAVELAGQGVDQIISILSHTLGDTFENLTLGGAVGLFGTGNAAVNRIVGGRGGDTLDGRGNADYLTGGLGADTFLFSSAADSTAAAYDRIVDLRAEDMIDLRGVDANSLVGGDQDFTLVSAFTRQAGQMTQIYTAVGNFTQLLGDTNGDGRADFRIWMAGNHASFDNILGAG